MCPCVRNSSRTSRCIFTRYLQAYGVSLRCSLASAQIDGSWYWRYWRYLVIGILVGLSMLSQGDQFSFCQVLDNPDRSSVLGSFLSYNLLVEGCGRFVSAGARSSGAGSLQSASMGSTLRFQVRLGRLSCIGLLLFQVPWPRGVLFAGDNFAARSGCASCRRM